MKKEREMSSTARINDPEYLPDTDSPSVEVRRAYSKEDIEKCMQIRYQVFVFGQGVPMDIEIDALDKVAMHFLMEVDGQPIGTARIINKGDGIGKIGRVALLMDKRGMGYGRELMWYLLGTGFRTFHTLVLDSQIQAIPFYEKLGFEPEGDMFEEAGIEHLRMLIRR
jgi:predicted GNAT family N-acyltransferase